MLSGLPLGSVRKLLDLTFQGETRDTDGMVWGDVEITGLTSNVRREELIIIPKTTLHIDTSSIGIFGADPGILRASKATRNFTLSYLQSLSQYNGSPYRSPRPVPRWCHWTEL
jgi:hypothetical protein